ncbi:hypothetical protein G6F65_015200 [Rhizopus arrhizus]|nr:hypothetical protein G6F65_015200 [Rhizopus arrhizus]
MYRVMTQPDLDLGVLPAHLRRRSHLLRPARPQPADRWRLRHRAGRLRQQRAGVPDQHRDPAHRAARRARWRTGNPRFRPALAPERPLLPPGQPDPAGAPFGRQPTHHGACAAAGGLGRTRARVHLGQQPRALDPARARAAADHRCAGALRTRGPAVRAQPSHPPDPGCR